MAAVACQVRSFDNTSGDTWLEELKVPSREIIGYDLSRLTTFQNFPYTIFHSSESLIVTTGGKRIALF